MTKISYDALIEEITGKVIKKKKQPYTNGFIRDGFLGGDYQMSAATTAETDWSPEEIALPMPEDADKIRILNQLVKLPSSGINNPLTITKLHRQYNEPFTLFEPENSSCRGFVIFALHIGNLEAFPIIFTLSEYNFESEYAMEIAKYRLAGKESVGIRYPDTPPYIFTTRAIVLLECKQLYKHGMIINLGYYEI